MSKSPFQVSFPKEFISDWVREEALKDGMLLEHQSLEIDDIRYDLEEDYLHLSGSIITRLDS